MDVTSVYYTSLTGKRTHSNTGNILCMWKL